MGQQTMKAPKMSERETFGEQMREFLRRNFNWFLAAGFALLLLQDIFGTHGVLAMRRTQQEATKIRMEINQLDDENRKLQERVKALKSDPATIERIARQEMHLYRPGELVFETHTDRGGNLNAPLPSSAPAVNSNSPQLPAACEESKQAPRRRVPSSGCAPEKAKPLPQK
jgi:cell division protein FtsB